MSWTRRRFLQGSAGAALAASPLAAAVRRNRSYRDDLRIAVIGLRSRGWEHVRSFERAAGARVVALCDVDSEVLGRRKAELAQSAGREVLAVTDYRRLLDSPDVDAISIATQNHWHALMAIQACQAGKDVYVEKPVSHNIWEGRQLVRAAAKYGRIVQCGTQSRSNPGLVEAVEFVRNGGLGRIEIARGLCYKPRPSIGKVDVPTPIPDAIDYDLWCGPAPKVELMRRSLHYDWHWFWATGNGDLGNQGIHQMDMCRMVLGEPRLAPSVVSFGGRLGYVDDGETPNTLVSVFEYEAAPLVFEVRGLPQQQGSKDMDRFLGASIGCAIHCEGGWLSIRSYDGAIAFDRDGNEIRRFKGGGDHFANFVEAVRERDPARQNGPIEDGHLSSALCHMGNVSYRVGAAAEPDAVRDRLQNDCEAVEAWWRTREHLAKNGVDLAVTPVTLGAHLRLDPETEWFVGEGETVAAANALAKGSYRAPFVVPEEV
ncbi:MAG: Gfo/Idh/MocA family oxidoreductase [Planctomycetes bacterium]|nr:Gfo/Idh/MocA family oxidoreductase [Planctomycetota bacterium]